MTYRHCVDMSGCPALSPAVYRIQQSTFPLRTVEWVQ